MTSAVAETEVNSDQAAADDQAGPTRRRIRSASLGRGERARKVIITIGAFEYESRCPKLVVWTNMAEIISEQVGSRGERRRAGDTVPADSPRVTTSRIRLTSAVSLFLRGCLTADDWKDLDQDLSNPDDELDLPDLWVAGLKLIIEFKPDMEDMARSIGMKIPAEIGALADKIDPSSGLLVDHEEQEPTGRPAPAGRKSRKQR